MSKLHCVHGMNQGDDFVLKEGVNIVGRDRKSDVYLFDKKCSRQHCKIIKKGNKYSVEDLGSSNGTWLQQKKIKKIKTLKVGDVLVVGHTSLVLSDKPVGNIIDQTATNAVSDMQMESFHDLMGEVSKTVTSTSASRKSSKDKGIAGFFKRLFGG